MASEVYWPRISSCSRPWGWPALIHLTAGSQPRCIRPAIHPRRLRSAWSGLDPLILRARRPESPKNQNDPVPVVQKPHLRPILDIKKRRIVPRPQYRLTALPRKCQLSPRMLKVGSRADSMRATASAGIGASGAALEQAASAAKPRKRTHLRVFTTELAARAIVSKRRLSVAPVSDSRQATRARHPQTLRRRATATGPTFLLLRPRRPG